MAFVLLGESQRSISQSGIALFQSDIVIMLGNAEIDLISAPIPPGNYELKITVAVGGAEIYLPRYVQFTLDGASLLGDKEVKDGAKTWEKLVKNFGKSIALPPSPPEYALAAPNPENPVSIRFIVNTGIGDLDVYRL